MLPSTSPSETSSSPPPALLALSDGTVFTGQAIGVGGHCVGELDFSTVMCGYEEEITDTARHGRVLAFTYPHIGNTGINERDGRSPQVQVSGLIMRDYPIRYSHFSAETSLAEYLETNGVVAITGVDTRRLIRRLRMSGHLRACILVGTDRERALALAMGDDMPSVSIPEPDNPESSASH